MNWRAIMRGEARELYSQYSQNPQNSVDDPNIEDIEDIEDRGNALKTGNLPTDNTDFRHLTSVHHPGVLDEKPELVRLVKEACTGLSITPDQFMVLLNDQDKAAILDGEIPVVPTLRAYAKSFSKGIQSGRIKFHPTSGALLEHL